MEIGNLLKKGIKGIASAVADENNKNRLKKTKKCCSICIKEKRSLDYSISLAVVKHGI